MTQKTFDGQTAHFCASVLLALPRDLETAQMQFFINNPKTLKSMLEKAFNNSLASEPQIQNNQLFLTDSYFKNNEHLDVWGVFKREIVDFYPDPIRRKGIENISFFEIPSDEVGDAELLKNKFGKLWSKNLTKFITSPDQLSDLINENIFTKQGRLSEETSNVFYMMGHDEKFSGGILCTVIVAYAKASEKWCIRTSEFNERRHRIEDLIFLSNNLV